MAGIEVLVFLHHGDLQDTFQDMRNPQSLELVECHLVILWMNIIIIQSDMGRDMLTADHLLPSLSIKSWVGLNDILYILHRYCIAGKFAGNSIWQL